MAPGGVSEPERRQHFDRPREAEGRSVQGKLARLRVEVEGELLGATFSLTATQIIEAMGVHRVRGVPMRL